MDSPTTDTSEAQEPEPILGAALRRQSRPLLRCPSGNVYRVCKPLLSDVINCGILPENFTARTLQTLGGDSSTGDLTDRDLLDSELAKQATVTVALLEPRVVENATGDDEILYRDIPKADREYIYQWATRGLPEVPIELEGGKETTVGAVTSFPTKEGSGQPVGDGDDGEQINDESLATSSNQG
jgi:hypothetical protein